MDTDKSCYLNWMNWKVWKKTSSYIIILCIIQMYSWLWIGPIEKDWGWKWWKGTRFSRTNGMSTMKHFECWYSSIKLFSGTLLVYLTIGNLKKRGNGIVWRFVILQMASQLNFLKLVIVNISEIANFFKETKLQEDTYFCKVN